MEVVEQNHYDRLGRCKLVSRVEVEGSKVIESGEEGDDRSSFSRGLFLCPSEASARPSSDTSEEKD